jgi:hypothetical protein
LQELIAPSDVQFYNHNWEYLTDKLGPYMEYISHLCGISIGVLGHFSPLSSVCAGEKMSWAAGRSTTREEDMAYCLLGIFDVNMPLLYGEGRKAFARLQEHIIAADEDCTLLLTGQPRQFTPEWYSPICCDESDRNRDSGRKSDTRTSWSAMPMLLRSILADSPDDFKSFRSLAMYMDLRHRSMPYTVFGEPPQITSRGLRTSLFITKLTEQDLTGSSALASELDVFLRKIGNSGYQDFALWARSGFDVAQRLHLGTFSPLYSNADVTTMACIPLFRLNPHHVLGTYARVLWFFTQLRVADSDSSRWKLGTCYIKTRTCFQYYMYWRRTRGDCGLPKLPREGRRRVSQLLDISRGTD